MDSRRHQGGRRFDNGGRRFRRGGGRGSGPMWFKGEGYNDHESVCIAEEVAGISGFLTPAQRGFKGVVKQRFADFVVHELSQRTKQPITLQNVAKKGKTAQLAFQERVLDFVLGLIGSVRQLARKLQQTSTKQQKLVQVAQEAYHLKQLVILVTQEIGAKKGKEFEQFLEKVELARVEFEAKAKEVGEQAATNAALAAADGLSFYLGGLNEKADRVFIHETMRRYGKSRIVADTLNIGSDTAVIRVRPHFAVKLLPGERDSRRDWPVGQRKCVGPDYLQLTLYKRNKDTSAVINQLASVLKISPALFSFADVKDKRGITTQLCTVYRVPKDRAQVAFRPGGTKKLEDQQYLVGDLRYVSRKLELGDCAGNRIAMVIRSWERRGFINFYGLHRFGNASTSYHLLGRAMLRKDYKLAVLLLLRPQEGEASKIRAAREHFRKHKDVAAALRMLPPFLVPERAVLEGHQQHGIDAHELAFNNIPKPLRVSYIETYQNFVWNEMASMRVAKFSSTSAVVGDLVLPARKRMRTGKTTRRQLMQEVMELTEANASQYSIEDVVLPLPGHAVKYPTNEVGAAYRKMLTTDGIDLNAHFGPDGSQLYVLDGSYRHLVKKPTRVSFQLERYADPTKPLIPNDESHRAMILEFDLDYGCDATIAIRELMKQSSSAHVNWQTPNVDAPGSEAAKSGSGSTAADSASSGSRAGQAKKADTRKVIKAQKKTQVAIGRPGFSLGRS
ncbi:pseudouridylate synthase, putative [Phytophthora infestans T30-4]|uniref:Pseudouridylate synthase, putative n=1 Tax=Phytophthora infestans (strain T30-4) TaxID=403677 RepID=D0MSA4_PHYIT|nr:pseudouridylate synthase, putative [Phytophthora infestans T30-4]EEY58373.1 pseudouridylate synthase, putative [Phytophthora infestans T30-4]|eukprot:XP_002909559.1 pseudouridylate synthase, putative [Phytophthora infestans T30-4]